MLLICRILQGAGGGGLQPMAQAIMADSFEEKKRGQAFALYALVTVLAPSIGPTIGGWITDNYNWRWIFYINIPCLLYTSSASRMSLAQESLGCIRFGATRNISNTSIRPPHLHVVGRFEIQTTCS